jgi:hypothetical protein
VVVAQRRNFDEVRRRELADFLRTAPPSVLTVLNAMSIPAFLVGRSCERLAYNLQANALCDFDYAPDGNFLRSLFNREGRAFIVNWQEFTRQMVAMFRKRSASVLGDPAVVELIDDLSRRSREFRQWWSARVIPEVSSFQCVCDHPFAGRLELEYSCFGVLEYPDLVAVALATPREDTRRRLAELVHEIERGAHDEHHNIWRVLASQRARPVRADEHHDLRAVGVAHARRGHRRRRSRAQEHQQKRGPATIIEETCVPASCRSPPAST